MSSGTLLSEATDEWPFSLLGGAGRAPLSSKKEVPVRFEALSSRLPRDASMCMISGPKSGLGSSVMDTSWSWLSCADTRSSAVAWVPEVFLACWKPRWPTTEERRGCRGLVLRFVEAKRAEFLEPSVGGMNFESRKPASICSFSSQLKSHVDSASRS